MKTKPTHYRNRLYQAVHAEGAKRGMDHEAIRGVFGARSLADVTDSQLAALYKGWTGKGLKRRAKLPAPGENKAGVAVQIVSGDELLELGREFARREMGQDARGNFIRRQLRGRSEIRTRRDYIAVIGGLRAMSRRDAGGESVAS